MYSNMLILFLSDGFLMASLGLLHLQLMTKVVVSQKNQVRTHYCNIFIEFVVISGKDALTIGSTRATQRIRTTESTKAI